MRTVPSRQSTKAQPAGGRLGPSDDDDDDNNDDDKPVDAQWLRKCLGPWPDPSHSLLSQFRLGSLTPSHYDDDDDDDDDDNDVGGDEFSPTRICQPCYHNIKESALPIYMRNQGLKPQLKVCVNFCLAK